MERLLADAEKLSGQTYSIDNLGDVYDAIHVIQQDLGLTGVAAAEASETFSGSFNAMKASAQNLLGSLAVGENVGPAMTQLATSVSTFFFSNFLPMIGTLVKSLPTAIFTFLQQGLPMLVANISTLLTSLGAQITALANNLSGSTVQQWITTTLPKILAAGGQLIGQLAQAFITNLPKIVAAIGRIGLAIITGLGSALWGKVSAAAAGIRDKFMAPINNMRDRVKAVIDKIKSFFPLKLGKIINFTIPKISLKTASKEVLGKTITYPAGFDVSWHARGGIFTEPTLLQSVNGGFHGVGDGGPEAIVPLNALWQRMEEQSARTEALLAQQTQILAAIYEEEQKEKNFRVDGMWAGRYVNSLVR